jgi:threonine synthase
VCILTGHQLKDPDVTVGWHSGDTAKINAILGRETIRETPGANRPLVVDNDLDQIIDVLSRHT